MRTFRAGLDGFLVLVFLAFFLVLPGRAQQAIQKQDTDWEGIQMELIEVKRAGEVLDVKFIVRNLGDKPVDVEIRFADVYVLDMVNKMKYSPYQGPDKIVFAGPLYDKAYYGRFWAKMGPKQRKVAWIKFPAPPPEVKKVSLVLPGVLPFEGVTISE